MILAFSVNSRSYYKNGHKLQMPEFVSYPVFFLSFQQFLKLAIISKLYILGFMTQWTLS